MRYGSFYNVTLTTTSVETQSKAAAMIAQLCPTFRYAVYLLYWYKSTNTDAKGAARLTYSLATTSKYELPAEKVSLEMVFTQLLQVASHKSTSTDAAAGTNAQILTQPARAGASARVVGKLRCVKSHP
jgi:hypothetical protein